MIGVVADDVTGATDVAVALRRQGLRTQIFFEVPSADIDVAGAHAVVIALKTRTVPVDDAVKRSGTAATWLRDRGAGQLYFKYCSTFDSTARGNIGPVLDALCEVTGAGQVVTTPSSPEHGRTQYLGHLFVHDVLLSESSMRNHPLTPMTDSYLPRVLDAQTAEPSSAVLPLPVVQAGAEAIRAALTTTSARYLLLDAVTDDDLRHAAHAIGDAPLVSGAAGLAGALGAVLAERLGLTAADGSDTTRTTSATTARTAVLAGSCSARTLEQVDAMRDAGRPLHRLDAVATPDPAALANLALEWWDQQPSGLAPLIYSSLPSDELEHVQDVLGIEGSAEILETAMARIARGLAERGVTRFVAAGGETSGSIVAALGVVGGLIGDEAAPGVPWIHGTNGLQVLLKSGNFGDPDLLVRASATEDDA